MCIEGKDYNRNLFLTSLYFLQYLQTGKDIWEKGRKLSQETAALIQKIGVGVSVGSSASFDVYVNKSFYIVFFSLLTLFFFFF